MAEPSEIKIADGGATTRQYADATCAKELRNILTKPIERCLVGIPTMDPKGSKYKHLEPISGKYNGWHRSKDRIARFLSPDMEYWSALISRPDCGAWMMTEDYAKLYQTMWLGRKVAVIGPPDNKIVKAVRMTQDCVEIECPVIHAYGVIGELEKKGLEAAKNGADLILASAGIAATCLAARLAPHVQCIDIGSIGGFLCHMLSPSKKKILLERTDDYNRWAAESPPGT